MLPLRFYWMLALRRLPLMMALVMVCSAIAVYAAMTLPPVYSSTARLQVESPQIPDELVTSIVQTEAVEQLQLIEEQLMTRANLLDIARKYQVFPAMDEMSPDSIVEVMELSTQINRSGGRNEATLMSITFTASDGQTAANVVNDYVTLVLEANTAFRRERAENTLEFFELETDKLASEIDAQGNLIIQFKKENVDALPEDLSYRQSRQATLQERLSRLEQERTSITNQRSEMLSLFESTGRLGRAQSELTPEERRLQELEQQLQESLAIYSDTNPRVVLLQSQIAQLEATLSDVAATGEEGTPRRRGSSVVDLTLKEMDQRVAEIDQEIASVSEELDDLARSISTTSTNAITLERMERDLDSIRARYNTSLNSLNQARMAERVEVNAQGQRISLIEGAAVQQDPSGPPRAKIAVAGVGGGMMLAIGIFVLFEFLNQKVRHPNEIQSRFEFVPIGVIPLMETDSQRLRRRALRILTFVAVIAPIPVALYYVHVHYLPIEELADKILKRIGLT